jgi:tRNA A-37 threonylcarbamoyl transferase component Bud32
VKSINRLFSVSNKWARNILWLVFRYLNFRKLCSYEFDIVNIQTNNWFRWHSGARCFIGQVKDSKNMTFIKLDSTPWRLKNELKMGKLFSSLSAESSAKILFSGFKKNEGIIGFQYFQWDTLKCAIDSQKTSISWEGLAGKLIKIVDQLNSLSMIHRDFTPSNILVKIDSEGNFTDVKLIDFAYAVALDKDSVDAQEKKKVLLCLGQDFKPDLFAWDDAYSVLKIFDIIEKRTGYSLSPHRVKIQARVGRLVWDCNHK